MTAARNRRGIGQKPRILNCLGCYWPGNHATGPNHSFAAMAEALADEFDFTVVARSNSGSYSEQQSVDGSTEVIQLPVGPLGARGLRKLLNAVPHELLLLNGFHDREFTIPALMMRRVGLVPRKPVILSPRGEFAAGALSVKPARKRFFSATVRALHLLDDVWLHATAEHERRDIEAQHFRCRGVLHAPNVRSMPDLQPQTGEPPSPDGRLNVIFLGRISPVKNLDFALEALRSVHVPVDFDIYGPVDDANYWSACQAKIARLPAHVRVSHKGVLPHDCVADTMARYDLLFLPSFGENFGHAIHEALSAGVPCLISDQTPWKKLRQQRAGWDIPLREPEAFVAAIEGLRSAPASEREALRRGARAAAEAAFEASGAVRATREMLQTALGDLPV